MITSYKYICFDETHENEGGKPVWHCKNKKTNAILAEIYYYNKWKSYVFTQYDRGTIFNDGCLTDISSFIKQLNDLLKLEQVNRKYS